MNIINYTNYDFKGVIVKLKDKSLVEKKVELEKELNQKKNQLEKLKKTSKDKKLINNLEKEILTKQKEIDNELAFYKDNLINKQKIVKNKIRNKVKTDNKDIREFKNTFNGFSLDIDANEIDRLKDIPEIDKIYLNYKVASNLIESVPLIQADKVWNLGYTGKDITVAVIDTGIDYTHPDLGGCFGEGCKVVDGYDFVNDDDNPMDDQGHGTHVAGIVSAYGSYGTNIKGVAPESSLVAYKVLNQYGSGYLDNIIAAIERAVDPNQDGNFEDHYDIISMSLGRSFGSPDDPDGIAVDNAVDAGVTVVIAAGNSGPSYGTIGCPGCARKAITIGASDKQDQIAEFSSRGPTSIYSLKPDVLAPGVNICSSEWDDAWEDRKCIDDKHIAISGTSMATPMVAGAVALIKQSHPDWSPEEIKYAIRNTALDLGYDFRTQGYGRIDALKAVTLNYPQPIAVINKYDKKIRGIKDLTGTASSNNFKNYSIYYGEGYDPVNWINILDSNQPIINGVLATFDVSYLKDNIYTIKLEVYDNYGQKTEDRTYFEIDNFDLISPGAIDFADYGYRGLRDFTCYQFYSMEECIEKTYLTKDNVEIKGNVIQGIISSYSIDYANEDEPDIWVNDGLIIPENNFGENISLVIWSLDSVKEGNYFLRLTVNYNDESTSEVKKILTVSKSMHEGWPKPFIGTFVTLADVDKNRIGDELVIGTMGRFRFIDSHLIKDSLLSVRDFEGNLLSGWPKNLTYLIDEFPTIDDLDNDGEMDIVISSGLGFLSNSKIFAFDKDGNVLSGWPRGILEDRSSQVIISDLNNDGKKEIITSSYWNNYTSSPPGYPFTTLHVLKYDGTYLNGWPKKFNEYYTFLPPSIGDINNDGDKEIVIALNKMIFPRSNPYRLSTNTSIYAFNKDGNIISGFPKEIVKDYNPNPGGDSLSYEHVAQLADIDNDSYLDIIVNLEDKIYVLDHNGNVMNGWPREIDRIITTSPVTGNLDKNYPGLEMVFVSGRGQTTKMFVLHADGTLLNNWPISFCDSNYTHYPLISSSPVLYDVNDDNNLDIISTCQDSSYNDIYAFDKDGNILSGWPKKTLFGSSFNYWHSGFSLGDANGDGILDMSIGSDQFYEGYSIFLFDLKVLYNQSEVEWGNTYHDPQHTGLYDKNLGSYGADICIESDGGKNLYLKGNLTEGENNCVDGICYDSCYNGQTYTSGPGFAVSEWWCENNIAKQETINCPNRCNNGACLNQTIIKPKLKKQI